MHALRLITIPSICSYASYVIPLALLLERLENPREPRIPQQHGHLLRQSLAYPAHLLLIVPTISEASLTTARTKMATEMIMIQWMTIVRLTEPLLSTPKWEDAEHRFWYENFLHANLRYLFKSSP